MSLQIDKLGITPKVPDVNNPNDVNRYNMEIVKFLDDLNRFLKKDFEMTNGNITTNDTELADHETRIATLET